MSVARRVVASAMTATLVGGAAFGACNADRIAGPRESDAPNGPRAAVVLNEQRVPFSFAHPNPCAPADGIIAFNGYVTTIITVTDDNSGGVHLGVQITEVNFSGVGTTGKLYKASREMHHSDNTSGPPPVTTTTVDNFRIIGPGPGDNFYEYTRIHVTTAANGQQTADVAETRTECR
jgi:hypothetical protein